jgi:hypothetical protein
MKLLQIASRLRSAVGKGAIAVAMSKAPALRIVASSLLAATPLAAGAAPAIVGGVSEETVSSQFNDKSSYVLQFSPVPLGRSLIVTDVSCYIAVTNQASLVPYTVTLYGRRANSAVIAREFHLDPKFTAVKDNSRIYQANQKVRHVLSSGDSPLVSLGMSSAAPSVYFNCTLTGDLI